MRFDPGIEASLSPNIALVAEEINCPERLLSGRITLDESLDNTYTLPAILRTLWKASLKDIPISRENVCDRIERAPTALYARRWYHRPSSVMGAFRDADARQGENNVY